MVAETKYPKFCSILRKVSGASNGGECQIMFAHFDKTITFVFFLKVGHGFICHNGTLLTSFGPIKTKKTSSNNDMMDLNEKS